ncbi:cyclophilin-like domain-containing protein [Zychaea mexicana]|uniref:cyclophilin-like domain-containing protein n=1 Tax=Zychaea mexicana TaxID=64656 RepID=UPI0022FE98C5|nr:cyclophilin-like domain-containing protein [Zychaea mexicana]KAI9491944.1 cyclophilin-like domain-containing protein [Zychaea mexicana]
MSNIYALEPHTNAKVILHTTAGDVEIELWSKETPKAARNFLQLCMEGYYDNTIFHRIVPNFIIQGGDPSGTGQGGESIYEDDEFPNEYHSRLRFNRRGLVGMANVGGAEQGSQFFITLDITEELTRTHTLFGRIAGDTIYNVLKMGEMETDANERPLYPPRIKTTEIVLNPFDDIVPRITKREKKMARALEKQKAAELEAKKKKKKEKKQLNLLSFGEEAEEMTPTEEKKAKKSSYDFLPEDKKVPAAEMPPPPPFAEKKPKSSEKQSSKSEDTPPPKEEVVPIKEEKRVKEKRSRESESKEEKSSSLSEIDKLKNDIRQMEYDRREEREGRTDSKDKKKKKLSLIEQQRLKYARRGAADTGGLKERKRRGEGDQDTLSKLMAFQSKLSSAEPGSAAGEKKSKEEKPPCKLHLIPGCESCYDTSKEDAEQETDEGWMTHKLVFEKDKKGKDLMQRTESVDDYLVIDPRARKAEAEQQERDKRKGKQSHVGQAFRKRQREHRDDGEDDHDDRRRRRSGAGGHSSSSSSSRRDDEKRRRDYR